MATAAMLITEFQQDDWIGTVRKLAVITSGVLTSAQAILIEAVQSWLSARTTDGGGQAEKWLARSASLFSWRFSRLSPLPCPHDAGKRAKATEKNGASNVEPAPVRADPGPLPAAATADAGAVAVLVPVELVQASRARRMAAEAAAVIVRVTRRG